jgi:hypothetical protein
MNRIKIVKLRNISLFVGQLKEILLVKNRRNQTENS